MDGLACEIVESGVLLLEVEGNGIGAECLMLVAESAVAGILPVLSLSYERRAEILHMGAYLVRSARVQSNLEQGETVFLCDGTVARLDRLGSARLVLFGVYSDGIRL